MELSELYQTFFDEARELLDDMERVLLELDPDAPDSERLHAIFRAAHSIKGGAGTFGFTCLQETTHRLENLLDRARHGDLILNAPLVDLCLETRDVLAGQVDAYRDDAEPDAAVAAAIGDRLQAAAAANASPAAETGASPPAGPIEAPATRPSSVPLLAITIRQLADKDRAGLLEELALFGELAASDYKDSTLRVTLATEQSAEDLEAVLCFVVDVDQISIEPLAATTDPATVSPAAAGAAPDAGQALAVAPDAALFADDPPRATAPAPVQPPHNRRKEDKAAAGETQTLRVTTDKIDRIINLVGELVITQSMFEQSAAKLDGAAWESLAEGLDALQRNARDLQDAVMSVRMMPMDYAFNRFPRLVRDLSQKLGKKVAIETVGAATELDKGLIERILDPMTHLVRNSLDHGLETPEARLAAGKSETGRLRLAAQHQGGHVLIEISDDGRGLDRERILDKARDSGLAVTEDMPDEDVWALIFAPGFSTAAEVTEVSGRGVGMDVVQRNIETLGGHVNIRSQAGQGTTISIVLPLTLAIMDGMLVKVGAEVYIVPLGAIRESMQVGPGQIHKLSAGARVIEVRGEYLPLVELHREFAIGAAATAITDGIVMVLEGDGGRFALLVDALVGQQQIVVKNLETHYRRVSGLSAATILGDGSVALILDAVALARATRNPGRAGLPINARITQQQVAS